MSRMSDEGEEEADMKLGLTGSIATGKSTVARMFSERGIPVIDADQIAREVVAPGSEVLQKIADHFGRGMLQPDGALDREKLGAVVFEQPEERETLNQIIHPAIRKEMKEQAEKAESQGHELVVMDIPLLFENNLAYMVDKTAVVYIPEELQKQRLIKRNNYTEKEAEQRISSQISIEEKKNKADFVVDNSAGLEQTEKQIADLLRELCF